MVPKLKLPHPVGAVMVSKSSAVPPVVLTVTTEPEAICVPVLPFVQAEHTLLASICPENVIVIVSPASIRPAAPLTFAATRDVMAVATLLSEKLAEDAPPALAEMV